MESNSTNGGPISIKCWEVLPVVESIGIVRRNFPGTFVGNLRMAKIVILFTNAPETYDGPQIVKSAVMDGCRMLDCPPHCVEHQTRRNSFGWYWTTSDIEEASLLRRDFPYWGRPDLKEATDKVLGGQP
jgi:hypothetical protein